MRSRTLLNIALFLFVALLAGYIYISAQQEQELSQTPPLIRLSPDQVTHIGIWHNQRRIELRKIGGQWQMLQPISITANAFRIDTLLNMLETRSHASYPVSELELDKYGLSEVHTSISFNDETIGFGIVNPINNYRYVRAGDSVHLIDDHFYPLLSSQTGTLVARELISGDAEIVKLELPDHTLYRDADNKWQSDGNVGPDAINDTLYHWRKSQAFGVHNYMPRDSLGDIKVYLAEKSEPLHFSVTDTDPWLIIARPERDIEYHFNLEFYKRLLKPGSNVEPAGEMDE
ncbi:MAG: hypothetical protein JSW45_09690 [Thiotrichales bacterium]|nr:MAG: hypothetical protein JSW45_09690 [Thiotrichales bacterium]